MQTVSSASSTCFRLTSVLEWAATVLMPSSLQARRMRSAISPRLAISTFFSIADAPVGYGSNNHDQWLIEFNGLAVFHQNGTNGAGFVRFNLVHHFHGFDNAEYFASLDLLSDLYKGA